MRNYSLSLILALLITTTAMPALAGSVSYVDMRGKWESTGCTPPHPIAIPGVDSEIPADELNAYYAKRDQFILDAQAYMQCISKEAEKDAQATSMLVTKTAQAIIDQTKAQVDAALVAPKAARN